MHFQTSSKSFAIHGVSIYYNEFMKLHETDAIHFNDYACAEPDSTIYQTSFWSDYMATKGYTPVFIEACDDSDNCIGISSLLLKKESFVSGRLTAYAPFGFLINYYDESQFREFEEMLEGYLKQKNVTRLIIEPQVDDGDHLVRKMLEDLGYVREEDLSVFEENAKEHVDGLNDLNIILKIRCTGDISTLESLASGKEDKEKLKIFSCLSNHAKCYVAKLDSFKSLRAIESSMSDNEVFTRQHRNDYKFVEAIAERENENKRLKKLFNVIRRQDEDPDIAAICVSDYSDKCSIVFSMNTDKEDLFHAEKAIVDQICADCKNRGIIRIDSKSEFFYSKERKLLGRFSLKI